MNSSLRKSKYITPRVIQVPKYRSGVNKSKKHFKYMDFSHVTGSDITVKEILGNGADINAVNFYNSSPLMKATEKGIIQMNRRE